MKGRNQELKMTLEEYKKELERLLTEASMVLSCSEYEQLCDWLEDEGLV